MMSQTLHHISLVELKLFQNELDKRAGIIRFKNCIFQHRLKINVYESLNKITIRTRQSNFTHPIDIVIDKSKYW